MVEDFMVLTKRDKEGLWLTSFLLQVLLVRLDNHIADNVFKKTIKNKAKLLRDELLINEKRNFDYAFNKEEENAVKLYNELDQYINKVSNVDYGDLEYICKLLDAYHNNKKITIE